MMKLFPAQRVISPSRSPQGVQITSFCLVTSLTGYSQAFPRIVTTHLHHERNGGGGTGKWIY